MMLFQKRQRKINRLEWNLDTEPLILASTSHSLLLVAKLTFSEHASISPAAEETFLKHYSDTRRA